MKALLAELKCILSWPLGHNWNEVALGLRSTEPRRVCIDCGAEDW